MHLHATKHPSKSRHLIRDRITAANKLEGSVKVMNDSVREIIAGNGSLHHRASVRMSWKWEQISFQKGYGYDSNSVGFVLSKAHVDVSCRSLAGLAKLFSAKG